MSLTFGLVIGSTLALLTMMLASFVIRRQFGPGPFWLTMGALTVAMWFTAKFDVPLDTGLGFNLYAVSPSCFFTIFCGVLLHFIAEGGPRTRRLIIGIAVVQTLFMAFEMVLQGPRLAALGVDQFTPRMVLSSTVSLLLDFVLLVTLFQAIYRHAPQTPLAVQLAYAMLATLGFDSLIYVGLSQSGGGQFWSTLSDDMLGKTLRTALAVPLLTLYLRIGEAPSLALASLRSVWEIAAPDAEQELSAHVQQANEQLRRELAERQRAEVALRTEQARFQRLVETTSVIPWESDFQSLAFTYVGPQAERILGYPVSSWYEPTFWQEHLHPDDCERTLAQCAALSEQHDQYEFEYRMLTSTGATVWLRDIVSVVRDDDGPQLLRGFLIDITERKAAEAQLPAQRGAARRAGPALAGHNHRAGRRGPGQLPKPSRRAHHRLPGASNNWALGI